MDDGARESHLFPVQDRVPFFVSDLLRTGTCLTLCLSVLKVKLADFGLANYIADDHHDGARPKNIIGTPGYYAPEMAKKER